MRKCVHNIPSRHAFSMDSMSFSVNRRSFLALKSVLEAGNESSRFNKR